ncbi:MAG: HEAT repeat domain-containing protein [Smithella sp.]|jgi:hypothetical protein
MNVKNRSLDDIKKLFANLLLTCKNVSLYPEGHMISLNSIRQFHETLETHIRQYGDIKFTIERDRVLCQEQEIHKGPYEEGTLPFTLFRDGIRWLEFSEGIKLEETREVLSIIHRYSVLTKEPEGDIVTAFWEAHFGHVLYEADDFFAEQMSEEPDNLSEPETTSRSEEDEIKPEDDPASLENPAIGKTSLGGLAINPIDFALTHQEQVELQEMVSREEKASTTEHLNMLLDILLQMQEEKDLNIVLGVLSEEFEGSFGSHDFEAALIILNGARKVLDSGRLRTPQAGSLIESFYQSISSDSRCLKPLKEIWSSLNLHQTETLKGIFQHLSPKAVPTLMHFLLLGQSSQLEKITEDTIISLACQDISCLGSLITNPDERIAEKLIPILVQLKVNSSLKYLMKLARHSSASVRRMAVKAIVQAHGNQTSAIFEFIDDQDASVRRIILTKLGQSRNEITEDLLTQYLQNRKPGISQTEHILECFQTLGKCGSARSIPFLHKTLLHRKWKKSAYSEGAAFALVALKIPEARQVIEAAGRSFYPGLRGIAREAGKEFFQKNRGGR